MDTLISAGFIPEIEPPEIYEELFSNSECYAAKSSVDLLEIQNGKKSFTQAMGDARLREELDKPNDVQAVRYRVFFLRFIVKPSVEYNGRLNVSQTMMRYLIESLKIRKCFLKSMFEHHFWDGQGLFVSRGENDEVERIEAFYRGECGRDDRGQTAFIADFTQNTVTYVVMDCTQNALARLLQKTAPDSQHVLTRPLGMDVLLLDVALNVWQDMVRRYRVRLFFYEYKDPNRSPGGHYAAIEARKDLERATSDLHNLGSDLYQLSEHLTDYKNRANWLLGVYDTYISAIEQHNAKPNAVQWEIDRPHSIKDSVKWLISSADIGVRWAINYRSRTNLYETLVQHTATQNDNMINQKNAQVNEIISRVNMRIANLTAKDNRTILALSVVALLFLPGTFVAGIFSMQAFFSSPGNKDDGLGYSKWIWLYFVITIPLTGVTFAAWWWWKQRQNNEKERDSWSGPSSSTGTRSTSGDDDLECGAVELEPYTARGPNGSLVLVDDRRVSVLVDDR